MMNKTSYNLITICVAERPKPDIICETITYSPAEIAETWEWVLMRRDIYVDALVRQEVPLPYEHCDSWECSMCRYVLVCDAIMTAKGFVATEEEYEDANIQDNNSDQD